MSESRRREALRGAIRPGLRRRRRLLPRHLATASVGGLAIAGRPYAFVGTDFCRLRFEAGLLVRVDGLARVAGPLSGRVGIAYAAPRWDALGNTCQCGTYNGPRGMHTV